MSISNDLFMAILAMDSYNRGYNEGLIVNGNQIGNATLARQSDTLQGSAGVDASFFAQAYTINDTSIDGLTSGQTVISYRGTDQPFMDYDFGFSTAWGSILDPQASA
jgi:hypothetical protein